MKHRLVSRTHRPRVGETIEGKFILRRIGIESAEIGFVGFPPDVTQRVPLGN